MCVRGSITYTVAVSVLVLWLVFTPVLIRCRHTVEKRERQRDNTTTAHILCLCLRQCFFQCFCVFVYVCVRVCICVCVHSVILKVVLTKTSEKGNVRREPGGGFPRCCRATRSLYLGFWAKDKPNHLTADSLRSFPQDNWSSTALTGKAND